MKRTWIALLLILAITLGLAPASLAEDVNFNATGYPIVDERVTLTALVGTGPDSPTNLNDITILKEAEEATNVHIEWIGVPAGTAFNDRKALMLATDDLPDIFYCCVTANELAKYGSEGAFVPMEGLIADYAPNLSAIMDEMDGLRTFSTAPDGHIYGVPKISEGPWSATDQIYGINTAWLNALGLEEPKTLADFEAALYAFKEGDPNGNGEADEIPFTFETGSVFSIHRFEYIFGALGLPVNTYLFDVQDGGVFCAATDDRYREGIALISKWYADGLIDPDAFIMDYPQFQAKVNAETPSVGVAPMWDTADVIVTEERLAEYGYMKPLMGENGEDPVLYCPPMYGYFRGGGVITRACEYPEVAMRYIDYWYESINSFQSMEGKIGERLFEQPDGSLQLASAETTQVGAIAIAREASCLGFHGLWSVSAEQYAKELRLPSTDRKVAHLKENVLMYGDPEPWLPVFYTAEESESISVTSTDIQNYINRKSGEWILNGTVDEEWDAYLAELEKMGIDSLIETMQTAYDRFTK